MTSATTPAISGSPAPIIINNYITPPPAATPPKVEKKEDKGFWNELCDLGLKAAPIVLKALTHYELQSRYQFTYFSFMALGAAYTLINKANNRLGKKVEPQKLNPKIETIILLAKGPLAINISERMKLGEAAAAYWGAQGGAELVNLTFGFFNNSAKA